jgi:hypothetical protein
MEGETNHLPPLILQRGDSLDHPRVPSFMGEECDGAEGRIAHSATMRIFEITFKSWMLFRLSKTMKFPGPVPLD